MTITPTLILPPQGGGEGRKCNPPSKRGKRIESAILLQKGERRDKKMIFFNCFD